MYEDQKAAKEAAQAQNESISPAPKITLHNAEQNEIQFDTSHNAMKFNKKKNPILKNSLLSGQGKAYKSQYGGFSERPDDQKSIADSISGDEDDLDSASGHRSKLLNKNQRLFKSSDGRSHKRNKSLDTGAKELHHYEPSDNVKTRWSFKNMTFEQIAHTQELFKMEMIEVEKRIIMIKTFKQQRLLKSLKHSASPSTQEIKTKMDMTQQQAQQLRNSTQAKGPVRGEKLNFQSMLVPNSSRFDGQDLLSSNKHNIFDSNQYEEPEPRKIKKMRKSIQDGVMLLNTKDKTQRKLEGQIESNRSDKKKKSQVMNNVQLSESSEEENEKKIDQQQHDRLINTKFLQDDSSDEGMKKIKRKRKVENVEKEQPKKQEYVSSIGQRLRQSKKGFEENVIISNAEEHNKETLKRGELGKKLKDFKIDKKEGRIMQELNDEVKRERYFLLKQKLDQGKQNKNNGLNASKDMTKGQKIKNSFNGDSDSSLGSF